MDRILPLPSYIPPLVHALHGETGRISRFRIWRGERSRNGRGDLLAVLEDAIVDVLRIFAWCPAQPSVDYPDLRYR